MNNKNNDLREIPRLTGQYASNRTLPVIANLIVFIIAFAALGGLPQLAAMAFRAHSIPLAVLIIALNLAVLAGWLWFALRGGKQFTKWVSERAYASDGEVLPLGTPTGPTRQARIIAAIFVSCVFCTVIAGFIYSIPARYMQPLTAIYTVPFMLYLDRTVEKSGSRIMLLWPLLYGLHAVLIVAGVPLYFAKPYEALNVTAPVIGYGFFAALIAHIYSRVALRRLRAMAATTEVGE